MKANFLIIVFVFCCFLPIKMFSQSLCDGLVGDYNLNGNALDNSGNGNNATVFGAVSVAGQSGLPNTAFHFDGITTYMQVNDAPSLEMDTAVTIHVIFKPEAFYSGACQTNSLVSKWSTDNNGSGYAATFTDNVVDYDCAAMDSNKDIFYGSTSNNNWFQGLYDYHEYIHTEQWYCGTFVQCRDTQKIYLNGILKSSNYVANNIGINSAPLWFGMTNTGIPDFTGIIDEIKIYNRGLNDQEVMTLCNGTPCSLTGIKKNTYKNNIVSVYPNPNQGSFSFNSLNISNNDNTEIQISNMLGEIIYLGNIKMINGMSNPQINLPEMNNGSYSIRLTMNDQIYYSKLLISK